LIIGAAIRKEKVIPNGTPDSMKPKKSGIAEHEQKGVTIPNKDAITLPVKLFFPSSAFLVLSVVKKLLMIPTKNMIRTNRSNTFGTSNTKK
jgi:hypothetical protein